GIRIGDALVEHGDWSGPGATRRVGRDPAVELAVLEAARGGILRRGLAADHASVAVLTNVSDDHLGDWGVATVAELARVKRVVAEAVTPNGAVVSNADDPVLDAELAGWMPSRPDLRWLRYSVRGAPGVDAGVAGVDAWADRDALHLPDGSRVSIGGIPLALGGAARYNVENALAAAVAAHALGLSTAAIVAGLAAVRPDPRDNPGRTNLFAVGGARVLVDYAHNPDGFARLGDLLDAWAPPGSGVRRLLLFGQAGDRPDALVHALGLAAARFGCARYVLKPLPGYARGRDPSEVVAVLRGALRDGGVPDDAITVVADERAGVRAILDALRPGDVASVLVHEDLDGALEELAAAGAVPG
ncbi:MAG: Mur ligase family protein, partial [Myxococcota bacterium]